MKIEFTNLNKYKYSLRDYSKIITLFKIKGYAILLLIKYKKIDIPKDIMKKIDKCPKCGTKNYVFKINENSEIFTKCKKGHYHKHTIQFETIKIIA